MAFLPGSWWKLTAHTHRTPITNFVGSCFFEAHLSCTVVVVIILRAFTQTFSKHLYSELRIFLWHFPSDSCLKFIPTKKRRYSTPYVSRGMLLHQWRTEMHLLATNLMCYCVGFVMCGCFGNMYTLFWLRFFLIRLRFFLLWLRFFRAFFSQL